LLFISTNDGHSREREIDRYREGERRRRRETERGILIVNTHPINFPLKSI